MWNLVSTAPLTSAGEGALTCTLVASGAESDHRLAITARRVDGQTSVGMVVGTPGENLEDWLPHPANDPSSEDDHETSFRLLRRYASSARHRQ